jgi:hypothetical protein
MASVGTRRRMSLDFNAILGKKQAHQTLLEKMKSNSYRDVAGIRAKGATDVAGIRNTGALARTMAELQARKGLWGAQERQTNANTRTTELENKALPGLLNLTKKVKGAQVQELNWDRNESTAKYNANKVLQPKSVGSNYGGLDLGSILTGLNPDKPSKGKPSTGALINLASKRKKKPTLLDMLNGNSSIYDNYLSSRGLL